MADDECWSNRHRCAAKAVVGYLGIILGNMLDLNNILCTREPVAEAIRHLFARQAIPMTWDHGEANPLGTAEWITASCFSTSYQTAPRTISGTDSPESGCF